MSELWWQAAGFRWDPFGEVDAAREKSRFGLYAVVPPGFAAALEPQHQMVCGPLGGGKTAFSRLLAAEAQQLKVLVILCTDVGQLLDRAGGEPGAVTDVALVEQILQGFARVVPEETIAAALPLARKSTGGRKDQAAGFDYRRGLRQANERLGTDHPRYKEFLVYEQRLQDGLTHSERYGDSEVHRSDRAQVVEQLNQLCLRELHVSFNQLCSSVEWDDVLEDDNRLRAWHASGARKRLPRIRTPFEWLVWLVEVARRSGYEQVYVVYDSLDGHAQTRVPAACAALVRPLLESTALLAVEGLCFKLFLPLRARSHLRDTPGLLTGRVAEIELRWSEAQLREVLRLRLQAASDNKYESLAAFSEQDDVDDQIIQRSSTPRDMLLLGRQLFRQCRGDATGPLLTREDIETVLGKRPRASKEGDHDRGAS